MGGDGEATRDTQPPVTTTSDPTPKQAAPQGESARTTSLLAAWADAIEQVCAPVYYLCVSDATDGHAGEGAKDGRALHADGRELQVLAVSTMFNGMSRPARQQVVNAVLADAFKSGALHSLQTRCWTPEEWLEKGSPMDLGAGCTYSYSSIDSAKDGNHGDFEVGPSLRLPGCTTSPPFDEQTRG